MRAITARALTGPGRREARKLNERSSRRALLAAAVLTAGLLAAGPAGARDKDYYFPEVRIEVAVGADGAFTVDEYRTFAFEGEFSYAYVIIPLQGGEPGYRRRVEVTEIAVTDEQGRPLRLEVGEKAGRLTAKWFYSARDERRTFHIRYHVSGGIVSYAELDPKAERAYYNMSLAYQKLGELDKAIAMAKKALDLDPGLDMARYTLGGIYFENNQYKEPEDEFRAFLKIYPYFPNAHPLLGVVYAGQRKFSQAIAEFENELKVDRYHTLAHLNLGQLYWYEYQNREKAL